MDSRHCEIVIPPISEDKKTETERNRHGNWNFCKRETLFQILLVDDVIMNKETRKRIILVIKNVRIDFSFVFHTKIPEAIIPIHAMPIDLVNSFPCP